VAAVVNINDVLDGHVALDLDCLDRIYLNAAGDATEPQAAP
jgi:hypothetical protein